jgi:RNA polymerase subunit RPABC4/transcription elongation factor Spt4
MPEIQIPSVVITGLQVILAFVGAFLVALWLSMIIWTFKDVRSRSRDVFAILLATLMVVIFGPLGLLLYFLLRPPTTLAEQYERALEEEALLQDLEERPRCPGCSRQVDEAWILCPDCHTTLKKICPQCENSLNLQWNICPFCGTHVSTAAVAQDDHHDHSGEVATPEQQTRPMPAPVPPVEEEMTVTTPPTTRSDETRPQLPQTDPAQLSA